MREGIVSIQYKVYQNGYELLASQLNLLEYAESSSMNAYAPYSNYFVGAAILLDDNTILKGCNQENASYPCGICAERAVLFSYGNLPNKARILKMAICVKNNYEVDQLPPAPCGLCRQVMCEIEIQNKQEIELIIGHKNRTVYVFKSLHSLLPFHFHGGFIAK